MLCLLFAAPVRAGDLQARIDAFVGPVAKAAIDPRTVRPCAQEPAIDWYGSVRRAVLIACAGSPGWRVFVPVRLIAGAPAASAIAFAPVVIKRGDAVQIHAGGPGFQISSVGEAQQDGRVGGRIRVRNAGTGTVTAAVVESAGNVSLPGYSSGETSR